MRNKHPYWWFPGAMLVDIDNSLVAFCNRMMTTRQSNQRARCSMDNRSASRDNTGATAGIYFIHQRERGEVGSPLADSMFDNLAPGLVCKEIRAGAIVLCIVCLVEGVHGL